MCLKQFIAGLTCCDYSDRGMLSYLTIRWQATEDTRSLQTLQNPERLAAMFACTGLLRSAT